MPLAPPFMRPNPNADFVFPACMSASVDQYATAAGAAVVTVTAPTDQKVIIDQVIWSYNSAPTGGAVTITDGTITFSWDVTAAGPNAITFSPPQAFLKGANVTVTLAAPGGSIVGKVIVLAHVQG